MKNIKILTIPLLIFALSSCGASQTEQSVTSETTTEFITEATSIAATTTTVSTETSIEITTETEITTKLLEYAEVVHNYEREFYDFIELEEVFLDDASDYENISVTEEIKSDFEAYLKEFDTVYNVIKIAEVVSDDFDGNGTEETFIILKCDIEFSNMDFANDMCCALYFITDNGDYTKITVWEKITIDKMYIYPDEKQLVISCINIPTMEKIFAVFAYDGEEIQDVLILNDEAYKDNCFLNSDARVGVWNPVQPSLWYWNKEDFCYEYVHKNRIHIDDFRIILENSTINDEKEYNEILKIAENCNDVIGIANHIFVLYDKYGENVVTLLEDGSFKLNIDGLWGADLVDNYNCDIDYFEAVKNMIPVE